MSTIRELNETALERLRAVDAFVRTLVEMETLLHSARMGAARARTIVGHTYTSVCGVDDIEEMVSTVRVDVTKDGQYSLVKSDEDEKENEGETVLRERKKKDEDGEKSKEKGDGEDKDEEEKEEEKKKVAPPSFRPFGILEPRPAKEARKDAFKAAELAISAASLRSQILECDRKTQSLLTTLPKDDLESVFKLLSLK